MGRRRRKSSGKSSESSGEQPMKVYEEEQRDEDVPEGMMTPQFNESGINAQSTPLSSYRTYSPARTPSASEHETLLAGNLNLSNWMESTLNVLFTREKPQGSPNNMFNRCYMFLLALAVIVAVIFLQFRENSTFSMFESKIPQFGRTFSLPVKDQETLIHIGEKWLSDENPAEPIILTVAGKKSNTFVTGLLKIAGISIGKNFLRPKKVSSLTNRADLHNQVFSSDEKVIAITSVEEMPWDVPLVLHAIADHISQNTIENSLIILAVDMHIPENSSTECDVLIERELYARWKEAGGDQDNIPPILSRILGYTICL